MRGHLGDKVYETIIPRNVRVSEAPSHGKPVLVYRFGDVPMKPYVQQFSTPGRSMPVMGGRTAWEPDAISRRS